MHQPSQVPHCRASPPVPASAPRMGWAMPSPGSLTCERDVFFLREIFGLDFGGISTGKPQCYLGMQRGHGCMAGSCRPWCCPAPNPATSSHTLWHPWIQAPPEHLRTFGLPFSLVTFHYGTPFNFSYLIFGIFTVDIISTYFLP